MEPPDEPNVGYAKLFIGNKVYLVMTQNSLSFGSAACVYTAIDIQANKPVVLKTYENQNNAFKESRALNELGYEYELGEVDFKGKKRFFVIEPKFPGDELVVQLKSIVAFVSNSDNDVVERLQAFSRALHYFKVVAQQVQHMHAKGVAHNDIHFSNVLFDESTQTINIIDFDKSELVKPLDLALMQKFGAKYMGLTGKDLNVYSNDLRMLLAMILDSKRSGYILGDEEVGTLPQNVKMYIDFYKLTLKEIADEVSGDRLENYLKIEGFYKETDKLIEQVQNQIALIKLGPEQKTSLSSIYEAEKENLDDSLLDMLDALELPSSKSNKKAEVIHSKALTEPEPSPDFRPKL